MKYCANELIALPHNADLDHLGAVRCLMLRYPSARILHPVRLRQNAWEYGRKLDWFKTVKFNDLDFSSVKQIYLAGIEQTRQNPELIEEIARFGPRVTLFSDRISTLPFDHAKTFCSGLSLTASLLNQLRDEGMRFSTEDLQLFKHAIIEKTWAGLSARVKPADNHALNFLQRQFSQPGKIANNIVLGMREGQTGLYHHMLKNIEDIQPGYWPISLIAVKTTGQVQDIEPVVDAVWSDVAQPVMIVMLSSGGFTRVWARSSLTQIDFAGIFKDFRPNRVRRWVYFHFSGETHEQNRIRVIDHLKQNIKPDLAAGDIMSASPAVHEW